MSQSRYHMLQRLVFVDDLPQFESMKNPIQKFLQVANVPADTQEQRRNKENLMLMTSHFTIVGVVWGTVFLVNGLWMVSCFPYSYAIISTTSLLILLKTSNFTFFRNVQLCLVLLLPFFIHVVLGGFVPSSIALLWSIVCPMATLFFITIRQSVYWFSVYFVLIIMSYLIGDELAFYDASSISESFINTMFLLNLGGVSILIFLVQIYFAKNERALKEEVEKQKREVQKTNAELSRKHEALTIEQGKTKQVLQKVENLFGQQVSLEVAKELITQENDCDVKNYEVTVLFLDIRDFSKFADDKTPAEVAAFQNVFFGEILNIVRHHQGITNQIIGDGIMAVFGAPLQNSTHVLDAVKAGYAMLQKVNELNEQKKIPPTRIGIGLHTGPVVAGNIGNDFRKQYSLTGTTVNIASRIEQLNKAFNSQFLVSEAIKKGIHLRGYPATYLEDVSLKGIKDTMKVYKLL